MKTVKIYFKKKSSVFQLVAGTGLLVLGIMMKSGFFFFGGVGVGTVMVFWSFKTIISGPQVIFSEEVLYLGFGLKKSISWANVVSVEFRKIDKIGIQEDFLVIIEKNGSEDFEQRAEHQIPIENLTRTQSEMLSLLEAYHKQV